MDKETFDRKFEELANRPLYYKGRTLWDAYKERVEKLKALVDEYVDEQTGRTIQRIRGWNENGATDHGGYIG